MRKAAQFYGANVGLVINQGTSGTYWSSTTDGADVAYYITFSNSGFIINNSVKSEARSVRCIKN